MSALTALHIISIGLAVAGVLMSVKRNEVWWMWTVASSVATLMAVLSK
jgi:hypothetical protein